MHVDGRGARSTKRATPEATLAREGYATSKLPSTTTMVTRDLVPEASNLVAKIGMTADTMSGLRPMMRDEIKKQNM